MSPDTTKTGPSEPAKPDDDSVRKDPYEAARTKVIDSFEDREGDVGNLSFARSILLETTLATLDKADTETELDKRSRTIAAYIGRITHTTEDKINKEVVEGLKSHVVLNAKLLTEMLLTSKDKPQIINALMFCLGIAEKDKDGVERSVDDAKTKSFATIKRMIDGSNKAEKPMGWAMVGLMEPAIRIEFGKQHLKSLALLKEANKHGVISHMEAKDIRGKELEPEDKAEFARLYKERNDFYLKAREHAQFAYGSTNQAGEMLTIKNTLLTVFEGAMWATIATNVGVNMWVDDAWKHPVKLAGHLVSIPHIWGAGGAILAKRILTSPEAAHFSVRSAANRSTEEKRSGQQALKDFTAMTPKAADILTGGGNKALSLIGTYTHKCAEAAEQPTPYGFMAYLQTIKKQDKDTKKQDDAIKTDTTKVTASIADIEKVEGMIKLQGDSALTIDGAPIDEQSWKRLTYGLNIWNITGDNAAAAFNEHMTEVIPDDVTA